MTTKEILVAARKRIEKPENWCQGAYAKDALGRGCPIASGEACQWCAGGAVAAEVSGQWAYVMVASALLHAAAEGIGNFSSSQLLNDMTDHATVMQMFDNAIARAA